MKKIISLLTIALTFTMTAVYAQTTHVVNNNPGAPGGTNVYTTFSAAVSAASAGDIIYVVPSSINYGDITINKSLTVFGAGIEPDKDLVIRTFVDQINITASDVRVSGLSTTSSHYWYIGNGASSTTFSNITIENCRFRSLVQSGSSVTVGNLLVRNCVISGYFTVIDLGTTSNVIITNNLINLYSNSYGMDANGATFTHNIFRFQGIDGTDGNIFSNVDNSFFEFNIFYGVTPNIDASNTGNTLDNNVSFNCNDNTFTGLGSNSNSGTGNIAGANPDFVNLPLGNGWSGSYDLTLGGSASTDVTNINATGETCGVTGGSTPWDPDGSLLPTVQSISMPSVIPVGSDLDVNVTGKGN